jgi:uncharacterized protein
MRLRRCGSVEEFLGVAGAFLAAREAQHNLLLGLCSRLRHDPRAYGSPPYLAVVEEGDGVIVAAAMRTAPFNLILSEMDDLAAIEPIARDAWDLFGTLPGALGPTAVVGAFADTWERLTLQRARPAMAQRIYRASSASVPRGVPGHMRSMTPPDRELVLGWLGAFTAEALPASFHREEPEAVLDGRFAEPDSGLHLWDDGGAVSLAGYSGPTPSGIRVGPVYTPPELRHRGYAGALVAHMTRQLLDGGRKFCFLFTDLSNPTSNSIYIRIGYQPVTDVDQYAFE